MDLAINDPARVSGRLTFTNFELNCPRAREIDARLRSGHDMPERVWYSLMRELALLCPVRTLEKRNIVVLSGRSVMARILLGDATYSGAINYGALGTDSTAPAASDTALGAEVARKLFARRTRTDAQVNFDFFYSQLDTDGTYEEFAMFIDGDASADSGQMFNHALTGGWAKTNTEAMTVSVQITINAS
ncbi:hypothetical protein GGQ85_003632 [Nitrobacter vulgaris]|uniref:hypothetical protein n=1 Tax=Nitrobacter vulgaris TaxID=29421 RepID=UPI00285CE10D|nr:hypothetical protein [Nitrobacter vulgaris]MDR6305906.1 hypothetical protein [Nitrobacter vulgaris]